MSRPDDLDFNPKASKKKIEFGGTPWLLTTEFMHSATLTIWKGLSDVP